MINKLKSWLLKPNNQAVFLFVFMFGLYLYKTPTHIVGYAWSDDFIRTSIAGNSIKAPQFFILQTLIGFLKYLFPFFSAKTVGYGLASFLGAGTVTLLYLIFSRLESYKEFPYKNQNCIFKFASVLLLGFSYYFFTQSIVIERYVLVVFLLSLLVYLSMIINKKNSLTPKVLYTIFLVSSS